MIVGTFSKIPKNENNHSYGWARTWSENLGVHIDHTNSYHDEVYLLPGANFGGALNLFGGFTEELESSINNLLNAQKITVLDYKEVPNYGELLKKRKDVTDKEWCDAVSNKLSNASTLVSSELSNDWLAIGDSHTAAYSKPGSAVVKQDGTTLYGQIKEDFGYIRSHIRDCHRGVTLSLGNIDVRHHICRHGFSLEPFSAFVNFVRELEDTGLEVEVAAPWPIEFEGRKLPKTGYYKGTPFYGSRADRVDVVNRIIDYYLYRGIKVVQCPEEWYGMDPEEYATSRMEKPQSVHLSPKYYRRKNWGVEETPNLLSFF